MKTLVKFWYFPLIAILLSSCVNYKLKTIMPSRPLGASFVDIRLTMSDFDYLGSTDCWISYKKYLGIFTLIDSINGQPASRHELKYFQFRGDYLSDPKIQRAMSPVISSFPNADYIVPVYSVVEKQSMGLASWNKVRIKFKAFKLKDGSK